MILRASNLGLLDSISGLFLRLSAMESLEMHVNFTNGEVNQLRAKEIPMHELQ